VFDNVVRNALRFAPAGSTVDIALKVSADGKRATLTVTTTARACARKNSTACFVASCAPTV